MVFGFLKSQQKKQLQKFECEYFELKYPKKWVIDTTDHKYYAVYILLILTCFGCGARTNNQTKNGNTTVDSSVTDSILNFSIQYDIKDPNIENTSGKQIDLLFNGIDNFLGGSKNQDIIFRTECMFCETVQKYRNGLLFARRLLITSTGIKYKKSDFVSTGKPDPIKEYKYSPDYPRLNFSFEDGNGSIEFLHKSCNDSDFNVVILNYDNGFIKIKNILNAAFFEYDLDIDGKKEQYLLGSRNCSQELVILRIN